jgi:hypothetical protein
VIYLNIARAVVHETRETRKVGTDKGTATTLGDEENEESEKSAASGPLTLEEAEPIERAERRRRNGQSGRV